MLYYVFPHWQTLIGLRENTQKQIAKKSIRKNIPSHFQTVSLASKGGWSSLPLNYSHSITTSRSFQKLFHTRVGNSIKKPSQQGRGVGPSQQEDVCVCVWWNTKTTSTDPISTAPYHNPLKAFIKIKKYVYKWHPGKERHRSKKNYRCWWGHAVAAWPYLATSRYVWVGERKRKTERNCEKRQNNNSYFRVLLFSASSV